MYKLIETKKYQKNLRKFLKHHPDMLSKYEKTIFLLCDNPHHPSLRLHKLRGELKELNSVSLDIQYRIVLDFVIIDREIFLIDIGFHGEMC